MLQFTRLMISEVTLTPEAVAADLRPVLLRVARELRKETEQLGVTARQATLLWLVKRSPGLSLAELAAEEGISPPAMSGHVDRLERAGFIERVRSTDDRRRVGLRLTEEGERLMRRVRARRTTWLADRLRTLDPEALDGDRGCDSRAHAARGARRMTTLAFALRARTFRSLRRHRNYRIFFTGQLVSLAGTWMQNVALAWLVIELSGSAIAIGALAFWRFVPFTVFGLVAGVVADRIESRKLVMATQGGAMAISIALAIVTLTGTATLPIVYVLAALGGIALAFDAPGRQSLTFQMVGPRELPNAVALNSGLFNGSRIIGPAIAGLVIAAVGTGLCFVVNAVSFLAVLTALALVREEELPPGREGSVGARSSTGSDARSRHRVERPAAASHPRGRHGRLDRRLQLPRARAAPRRRHAARRAGGLRLSLRRVRARRARRSARRGDVPRRELASSSRSARGPSACSRSCSRRCRTPFSRE